MPAPFKIKVTKNILELSKACGINNDRNTNGNNCAIACALKDIFPDVFVSDYVIYPFGININQETNNLAIVMPKIARDFVSLFDSLVAVHNLRPCLPEFEFSIDIPDSVISEINIDEIKALTQQDYSCYVH